MQKRFSEAQIIGFLKEADSGGSVKELCRRHGFSEASYYLWRSKFGGMDVSDAKRLKALSGAAFPSFPAIDAIAAHCDACWPADSITMRTARSWILGEYRFVFFMAPSSQALEPPQNPGRFKARRSQVGAFCFERCNFA